MPGIAPAGKVAVSVSHSAAPTGALYSSTGVASAAPAITTPSASRARSNGA